MILYARNFLNHPKRFSRWYKKILLSVQKDFTDRTKRSYWASKKILLIVQKDFPTRYKKILLIVQKHFTDRTKSFYQAVNIKILQIIWENKKRKIKNNDSTNIFKYTFSVDNFEKNNQRYQNICKWTSWLYGNKWHWTDQNRLTIEFNKNAKIILEQKKCWLTISKTNSHYCF